MFIDVAERLRDREDLVFHIIGGGSQYNYVRQRAKNIKRLYVHGEVTREELINDYLPEADIVVNTSLNEGTCVSLIEAQAAGRIVIATDVGGTRDIMYSAYLVSSNDEEKLVNLLLGIVKNWKSCRSFAGLRRNMVIVKFDLDIMVSRIFNLYKGLLS